MNKSVKFRRAWQIKAESLKGIVSLAVLLFLDVTRHQLSDFEIGLLMGLFIVLFIQWLISLK